MYVTFEEYGALGYNLVPEGEFARYEARAEAEVRRQTGDCIADADICPPDEADEETRRIAQMNRRGICEILDVYYMEENPQSEKQAISSFSNEGYAESYAQAGAVQTVADKVAGRIAAFFTAGQRYRGVV